MTRTTATIISLAGLLTTLWWSWGEWKAEPPATTWEVTAYQDNKDIHQGTKESGNGNVQRNIDRTGYIRTRSNSSGNTSLHRKILVDTTCQPGDFPCGTWEVIHAGNVTMYYSETYGARSVVTK